MMVYTKIRDVAAYAAERIACYREIAFSIQVSHDVQGASLLQEIYEQDPRLLECIDSMQADIEDRGSWKNVVFDIHYTDIMPSCVSRVKNAAELDEAVLAGIRLHRRKVSVAFSVSLHREMQKRINNLLNDPAVLGCYVKGIKTYTKTRNNCSYEAVTIQFMYSCSYGEWRMRDIKCKEAIDRITGIARAAGTEDWRKAYAVVDYCVRNWQYGSDDEFPGIEYTAYGALVKNKAVCMGISLAVCELFEALGIPCRYVYGTRKDSGHAWNQVYIRQGWFYIDVTDAIGRKDPLFHWGMTGFTDRSIQHTYSEKMICNCDAAFIRRNTLRGKKGRFELEANPEEVLVYLAAGELTHIGKNTSFGFGRYTVEKSR